MDDMWNTMRQEFEQRFPQSKTEEFTLLTEKQRAFIDKWCQSRTGNLEEVLRTHLFNLDIIVIRDHFTGGVHIIHPHCVEGNFPGITLTKAQAYKIISSPVLKP